MQSIKVAYKKKKENTNEFQCVIMNGYCNFDLRRWKKVYTLSPLKYLQRKSIRMIKYSVARMNIQYSLTN